MRREVRHAELRQCRRRDHRADDVARGHGDREPHHPDDQRGAGGRGQQVPAGEIDHDRAELESQAGERHHADDDPRRSAGGRRCQDTHRSRPQRLNHPRPMERRPWFRDEAQRGLPAQEGQRGPREGRPEHRRDRAEAEHHEDHDRDERREVEPALLDHPPRIPSRPRLDLLDAELARVELDHQEETQVVEQGRDGGHPDDLHVGDLEVLGDQEGGCAEHRRRDDRAQATGGEQTSRRILPIARLREHGIRD